jgi:hypothetical protein
MCSITPAPLTSLNKIPNLLLILLTTEGLCVANTSRYTEVY